MAQTPQPSPTPRSSQSKRRRRKPWYRKSDIMGPLIVVSIISILAIIFNFPKIQQSVGLNNSNVAPTPNVSRPRSAQTSTATTLAANPTSSPTHLEHATLAYNFEGTTTGWDSSYQNYNPAFKLTFSTDQAYSGHQSLKVTTRFLGDKTAVYQQLPDQDTKNVYTYSDAKVYFTQEPPEGLFGTGPFNFQGKHFSCFVYFPQWLLFGGDGKIRVQLFAKNRFPGGNEPNIYSQAVLIDHSTVQRWVQLTLDFGNGPGNLGFDPTQVAAIGVLLTVLDGSTIEQTGSYYIDACSLPK